MDNIKQLEREVELLKEIIRLKERNLELQKNYIPYYPQSYPYNPNPYCPNPITPYPIITWPDGTGNNIPMDNCTIT